MSVSQRTLYTLIDEQQLTSFRPGGRFHWFTEANLYEFITRSGYHEPQQPHSATSQPDRSNNPHEPQTSHSGPYFRFRQAAHYLGVSQSTLRKWIREHLIRCFRPWGKLTYFSKWELDAFVLTSCYVKSDEQIRAEAYAQVFREKDTDFRLRTIIVGRPIRIEQSPAKQIGEVS